MPTSKQLQATLLAVATITLAGCTGKASQGTLNAVRENVNPADRSTRAVTNFTPALRCMDETMFNQGIRDVTLMMEDLSDATLKVPVSARDMMTSAVSDMTRRSRAIRLSVFGGDQSNILQFLREAESQSPFAVIPQYSLRGSISQLDDNVERRSVSVGASMLERLFGVRFSNDTRFSVMGFDAALVETASLTLLPGVTSKNLTVLADRDAGAGDGQGRLSNPGLDLVFSFSANRSEGPAQATRNMIELAAVELTGKLLRLPYWQCLGTSDDEPEVRREIEDWFLSMHEDERVSFVQERMRERRHYDGPISGKVDAGFATALERYRGLLGLPSEGGIDQVFFTKFITSKLPPGTPEPRRTGGNPAKPEPQTAPQASATTDLISMRTQPATQQRGIELLVKSNEPGYLYCYSRDSASGRIVRIFPNRFVRDPRVEAGQTLRLPDGQRFVLPATAEYACLHAPREVYGDLPPPLRWGDFDEVRLKSFAEIQAKFGEVSGTTIGMQALRP